MQVSSISGKWLGITLNKYLGTRSKASIFRFFLPLLMMVVYSAKAHRLLKVPDGQYFNFRCGGPSAGMAPSQNAKLCSPWTIPVPEPVQRRDVAGGYFFRPRKVIMNYETGSLTYTLCSC